LTETGFTAQAISRYRLSIPVVAVTDNQLTAESLTLSFGVTPIVSDFPSGVFTSSDPVLSNLVKQEIVTQGDTILIVHGSHWQKPGNTNALSIVTI